MGTAFLITTTSCTRKCPYCFYVTGAMDRTAPEMSREELVRCVKTLADRGYGNLILTGGEPLLRPDLPGIVLEASGAGSHVLLLTNGELLTGGMCALLRRNGLGAISVSVDSPEKGLFKSSLEAALLARRAGPPVTLITAITKKNTGYIEELLEWSKKEGIGIILQPAYVPGDSKSYRELSLHELDSEAWSTLIVSLERWAADYGAEGYLSLFRAIYEGGGVRPSSCNMGREGVVVDCDGSVYPCFHRRDLYCGNLVSGDPDTVFDRLCEKSTITEGAPCYGEHCLSLFFGHV